jgi:CRP-like cAMP-binding protein
MSNTLAYESNADIIHFLSHVSPFQRLTTDELRDVANLLWRQHFEQGEQVFAQGDHSSEAYIIESGKNFI